MKQNKLFYWRKKHTFTKKCEKKDCKARDEEHLCKKRTELNEYKTCHNYELK